MPRTWSEEEFVECVRSEEELGVRVHFDLGIRAVWGARMGIAENLGIDRMG